MDTPEIVKTLPRDTHASPAMAAFIIGKTRKQPDIMLCIDPECRKEMI